MAPNDDDRSTGADPDDDDRSDGADPDDDDRSIGADPEADPLHSAVSEQLRVALTAGGPAAVTGLLAANVTALIDGRGVFDIRPGEFQGSAAVARALGKISVQLSDGEITTQDVNGRTALVLRRSGRVVGVVCLSIDAGAVTDLWLILNPDKLRQWNSGA